MNGQLSVIHAEARAQELIDQAVHFKGPIRRLGGALAVTVRPAGADDAAALRSLALLDERPLPAGPLLVAEVSCRPLAALSLVDGGVIADPFVPTTELVALLRLRARQLMGRRWRSRLSL
jgi:hypothetical protein